MSDYIVETSSGKLKGLSLGSGVLSFRGIPYAAAPTAARRWKAPEPSEPWQGVRDATSFGADPIQVAGVRETRAPGQSEDCLFLNVWAPEEPRVGGWPVIVWSGGGAFSTGGGAFAEEDLSHLAQRGAVVVSFNYRLGIFGFLAHASLSSQSETGTSGNYGLMDSAAALRWVRENIAAFGGNAQRITYMAESSGAAAGLLLLSSTSERQLFDQAVLLSPGSVTPLLPLADAERSAASLVGSAEELRAMSASELFARTKDLSAPLSNLSVARPLRPIIDGRFIDTDQAYVRDRFDAVPVIIGTNADEGRFFTRRMPIGSLAEYMAYLKTTFGEHADEACRRYPAVSDPDVRQAAASVYGDVSINYPTRRLAQAFVRRQPDTYRFVYSYRHGQTEEAPTHSEEAGTFLDTRVHVTPRDSEMAEIVGRYLLAFAENGSPQLPDFPEWPRYEPGEEQYLSLDLPIRVGQRWRSDGMDFVAAVLRKSDAT